MTGARLDLVGTGGGDEANPWQWWRQCESGGGWVAEPHNI